jgi:predicted secreted hydrolase
LRLKMVRILSAVALVIAMAAAVVPLVAKRDPPASSFAVGALAALWPGDADGYAVASGPWRLRFPADHGAHPDYRTEVWNFSGTLTAAKNGEYGFQLAFMRLGVVPPRVATGPSVWAARDLYWAQFSLTDSAANRVHSAERFERAAMGLSGSATEPARVWVGDWIMEANSAPEQTTFHLRGAHDGMRIALVLRSAKPAIDPVAVARRQMEAGGFHGYLMTRLEASGTVRIGSVEHEVQGTVWLDRAWGLVPLPTGAVVWDQFRLHLGDGRELAAVQLRRRDGSGESVVTAMLVEQDGTARSVAESDVSIEALELWSSPHDGARFPVRWRLRLPAEAVDIELTPYVAGQERHTVLRSWVGAVRVSGSAQGRAIRGSGYVETSGYGARATRGR